MDDEKPPEETAEEQRDAARGADGRFGAGNAFRFPSGVSGNPAGRPKGVRALWQEHAEEIQAGDPELRKRYKLAMDRLFHRAVKDGNVQALREYFDRVEGKVPLSLKPMTEEDPESLQTIRLLTVGTDGEELERIDLKPRKGNGAPSGNGESKGNGHE